LPAPPPFVSTIVVSPNFARDGIVLAGTLEDGVFFSSDRGQSWVTWNFGLLDLSVLALAISPEFARDETLFVGAESGIFRSTNGGRAWRAIEFPMELAPVISLAISPGFVTDGILFAGTEAQGLYRSDDRGQSWARIGQEQVGETVNSILVSPDFTTSQAILIVLSDTLLISRDGGVNWTPWPDSFAKGRALTSAAAPHGLEPGALLLVGPTEGSVLQI
jgi:photosystem II stability/assembly factor-like uncharacterized protein